MRSALPASGLVVAALLLILLIFVSACACCVTQTHAWLLGCLDLYHKGQVMAKFALLAGIFACMCLYFYLGEWRAEGLICNLWGSLYADKERPLSILILE